MTVYVTISNAGVDVGPFNLYSDVDGFITAFETNIPKAILELGLSSANAPDTTTQVKIKSVNPRCNNSKIVDI